LGPITILVNNVSKMDGALGKLHKQSDDEIIRTVNANTCPSIYMTRILGTEMKKRGHKSAIINMSSYYSKWEAFKLPIFCAGSAFTSYFSQVVGYENPEMDVLTVLGMPVKSERNPRGVDANEVVEGVLRDIGKVRVSYGHWTHSLYRYRIL
jgi:short-subunit dehydrogenase